MATYDQAGQIGVPFPAAAPSANAEAIVSFHDISAELQRMLETTRGLFGDGVKVVLEQDPEIPSDIQSSSMSTRISACIGFVGIILFFPGALLLGVVGAPRVAILSCFVTGMDLMSLCTVHGLFLRFPSRRRHILPAAFTTFTLWGTIAPGGGHLISQLMCGLLNGSLGLLLTTALVLRRRGPPTAVANDASA